MSKIGYITRLLERLSTHCELIAKAVADDSRPFFPFGKLFASLGRSFFFFLFFFFSCFFFTHSMLIVDTVGTHGLYFLTDLKALFFSVWFLGTVFLSFFFYLTHDMAVIQPSFLPSKWNKYLNLPYRKVACSRLSQLVAHSSILRLFKKGKFDAYVLWPLSQRVQNWIVDRSTARDSTVFGLKMTVKSGLEKMFLKLLPAGNYFHLRYEREDFCQNYKFINKNHLVPAFKNIFSTPLFTF